MTKSLIAGLVVAALIIGGGLWFVSKSDNSTNNNTTPLTNPSTPTTTNGTTNPSTVSETPSPDDEGAMNDGSSASAVILYSSNGFSPASVTVKSGETIAIKNESATSMQFNSDPHPTHTENPELNVGAVQAGETKMFTVTTKGTFGFHNHMNDSQKGTITVQ